MDDTLSKLARLYPQTKFLRARAAALGFASTGTSRTRYASRKQNMPGKYIDDDGDDPYADDEEQEKTPYYDEDEYEEEDVDTDMLPTMLVYRDGELVHNWVRVDWEAGEAGVEELLSKYVVRLSRFWYSSLIYDRTGDTSSLKRPRLGVAIVDYPRMTPRTTWSGVTRRQGRSC